MKIGFVSLGCPKNLVDAEVMLGLAEQAGHEITPDAAEADVLVVNTCAFIDRAKQESVDTILEMAELKKQVPGRRLVVTGCLAERYRDELKREMPEIDEVLGTGDVPRIVEALTGVSAPPAAGGAPVTFYRRDPSSPSEAEGRVPASAEGASPSEAEGRVPTSAEGASPSEAEGRVPASAGGASPTGPEGRPVFGLDLPTYLYDADTPRRRTTPGHYAYVKIAEGCDYKCAFCIIPRMRGHYRSRPVDSIVREAVALAAQGVREILLISQDTTFYGIDRKERGALARLLRALDQVEGLEWVRLLYLYPTTITDETIDAIATSAKACKYIDLPLQHASDAVLKRMKRPGTRASYEALLQRLRDRIPGVSLRTTLIVGFPGETEEDFETLMDFAQAVRFDHLGVFTYSHEEGTSAFDLVDDVPARVKAARQRRLMALQKKIVARRQRSRIGDTVRLLVDGPSPEHELVLVARLAGQAPDIDPVVYLTDCDPETLLPGAFIDAEIVGARDYDLVARVL